MITITFGNGKKLENLTKNRDSYESDSPVDLDLFNHLTNVVIEDGDEKTVHDRMYLVSTYEQATSDSDSKYCFVIVDENDDYLKIKEGVSYIASVLLSDDQAYEAPYLFNDWDKNGVTYTKDMSKVQYNGLLYKCITSHRSQSDWTPDASPSLWVRIDDPAEEWPEWRQPEGAHDAYPKGAKVTHNEKHWTSDIDNNVWEPGVYGWTEETA